ncbi:MAG: GNAT family N-acetyltransferase [Gemmobacter sp.]
MTAPHLRPVPGAAAEFATGLRAALPVIETARCILRAPTLEDAQHWIALHEADAEGHLGDVVDAGAAFRDFGLYVGLWLLRGHGVWTVTDRAGTVLGFVMVGFEPGDREPELGWLLLPEARGRGVATEAAAAARDWALATAQLPALVSYVAPGNTPSDRVAQRLGARHDGTVDGASVWRHGGGTAA